MNDESPTTAAMKERWSALAREIYRRDYSREDKGRLVVLGSGMSFIDFTRDADAEIRSADHVFHCMYDKLAQAWIGKIRPDSYDVRILYGSDIDRYCTYVRMAEALLHYVRKGKKVVAIYYGHPGIFAMPAHRAIHIARSEGHEAIMRPGVSALDYLVADIGFDPALPGLLTFEATDMLLRRRRIDPTLHVVLWQVGVVGEFQFSPGGFENKGFDLLVDTLRDTYGGDWEVTHYIAPQYVGIEPLIERFTIDKLGDPEVRRRISSLSTFYIEPQQTVETDAEVSVALGHSKPGEPVGTPSRLYAYKRYSPRERTAIKQFGEFEPPAHYSLASYSPEVEFMLTLSSDLELQARYRSDPEGVVNDERFPDLSERTRKLLAIPHPKAIDAALRESEAQADDA
jgi:hypothetical protein